MNAPVALNTPVCPCCGGAVDPLAVLIDSENGWISFAGQSARLSRTHFDVVLVLLKSYPNVTTRENLYDSVYGMRPDCDWPEIKTLDVLIHKVRQLIAPVGLKIETVWGRGWRLLPSADAVDGFQQAAKRALRRRA